MNGTSFIFFLGCFSLICFIFGNAEKSSGIPAQLGSRRDDDKDRAAQTRTDDLHRELIEWMRSENAVVGHKQEVRLVDPLDPSSGYGVFATEPIEKGEILLSVPFVVTIFSHIEPGREHLLPCQTIFVLLDELAKGDASYYAAYLRYLKSIPEGEIPDGWSDVGQEILNDLTGEMLVPMEHKQEWVNSWRNWCGGNDDPYEQRMALIVAKRMQDGIMVPYSDFFTHRNGHWNNAEVANTEDDEKFEIVAKRTIQSGEEICVSFNMCKDCNSRLMEVYGTPDILHGNGVVERLPQLWNFNLAGKERTIELSEKEDGSGEFEISWEREKALPKGDTHQLEANLKHLDGFKKTYQENPTSIPDNEWRIIMEYHKALTTVNKAILDTMMRDDYDEDAFNVDEEDIYWRRIDGCFEADQYLTLEPFREQEYEDCEGSMFQNLCYKEDPEGRNKCFDLDRHVQMCSDHRPQYHEPFVHFTTSFLKELKRVAFVGGGDNMILHEVLKYPTVEFVIGLELDQKCVRKSFKHFHTQPHFEDERVQWWFGDATKSLTMLPKEYFGSFDLVLVDLSETATSLTVTERLDMFEALALLVKPEGIFVKNEIYIDKLSTIFDHTITLYEDHLPMVCKQDFSMGSNKVDFLKPNFELMKKYKPDTYVYKPLEDINTHYRIYRHYSKNDARAQGKCEKLDSNAYNSNEQRRAGIAMIVEAENAELGASMPAWKLEDTLKTAITKVGISPVSTIAQTSEHGGAAVIISMQEGYIVAHTWPEHNYVGLEIHLWSQFVKLEPIRFSLLQAVGSTQGPWSTYRIVAGGMLGTDNWEEEQATIGPRPIQSRDCEPIMDKSLDDTTFRTVMEETLSLIEKKDTTALVLCGDSTKGECETLEAFKNKDIRNLVAVWTCPTEENGESSNSNDMVVKDGIANTILCGSVDSIEWLENVVKNFGIIGFVAVDPDAAPKAIRKVSSLFRPEDSDGDINSILTDNTVIVVPILDESNKSRMALVNESRRRREIDEYVAVHEITVGHIKTGMKIWFTATRHPAFLSHVADVASSIKDRTGIESTVTGNKLDITVEMVPFDGYFGTMDDYETVPGLIQFSNQLPLGLQSIYQFEYKNEAPLSVSKLTGALERTLRETNLFTSSPPISTKSGDGALIFVILKGGHAVVLWDGGTRVDTNLFTYDESIKHKDVFAEKFMNYVGGLEYVLRDEMPRGTGHVVNSMNEIGTPTPGCYDLYQWCSTYAEEGNCAKDKLWMETNCLKSCGLC